MGRLMRALAAALLLGVTPAIAAPVTATDSLGRTVTLEAPARRILLELCPSVLGQLWV